MVKVGCGGLSMKLEGGELIGWGLSGEMGSRETMEMGAR